MGLWAFFLSTIAIIFSPQVHCVDSKRNSTSTWKNWNTQYLANENHNGFVSIPENEEYPFNPSNLAPRPNWTKTSLCQTSKNIVFANNMIYCTDNNIVYSIYPNNGTKYWSYLVIGVSNLEYVSFVQFNDKNDESSYGVVVYYDGVFTCLNTTNGNEINTQSITDQYSFDNDIVVTTNNGYGYITADGEGLTIYLWDIMKNTLYESSQGNDGTGDTVTLCGENSQLSSVIGPCASTYTYSLDEKDNDLSLQWSWAGNCEGGGTGAVPVCYYFGDINNINYRLIVQPETENVCYEFDAYGNGSLLNSFSCEAVPLVHFNSSKNSRKRESIDYESADVSIMATGVNNQIIATKIDKNNIIGEELWYNNGTLDNSVIVDDYLFTLSFGYNEFNDPQYLYLLAYDVYNGDINWKYDINTTDVDIYDINVVFTVGIQEIDKIKQQISYWLILCVNDVMYGFQF